jgi:hypothetical protein
MAVSAPDAKYFAETGYTSAILILLGDYDLSLSR